MTTFILAGNSNNKHAFNVELERNGQREKYKIHLEGGRPIVAEDIDVKLPDNGTVRRIKIDPTPLIEQLKGIEASCPSFVKFLKENKKKE